MEDEEIIKKLFEHSEDSLLLVKDKYEELLKNISYNILFNNDDANECLNDTYLKIWDTIPPYKPTYLKSYICKLVRQISIDKYRYLHRLNRNISNEISINDLDIEIKDSNDIDNIMKTKDLHKIINDFLSSLNVDDRVLFIKKYFFLESSLSLSEMFDTTEANINVKTMRLRKKLKERLESEGYIV